MTRVLYSFPHPLGSPGIGTTALAQVRALTLAGAEVTVVCTSLAVPVEGVAGVVETMVAGGQRVPHRAVGVERAWRYHDRRVARLVGTTPARWDVLHAWPLAARNSLAAARRSGVLGVREVPNSHTGHAYDVVARLHRDMQVPLPRGYSHRPDRGRLALESEEYELADVLLVPSEVARLTFVARAVPEQKLYLHRYGCDVEGFRPRSGPLEPVPFSAAFIGRCEPRKGLHVALEAWHASGLAAAGRLTISGGFHPGYERHVAHLMDHPSVRYMGFVDDTAALMRESHALMLPSFEEGSALVTYEAQAVGCVPLVSDAAGAVLTEACRASCIRRGTAMR